MLYEFSHGLSYTTFEYRNLVVSPAGNSIEDPNSIKVQVEVHNTGSCTKLNPCGKFISASIAVGKILVKRGVQCTLSARPGTRLDCGQDIETA